MVRNQSKEEFKHYLEQIIDEDEERIQKAWYVLGMALWILIFAFSVLTVIV